MGNINTYTEPVFVGGVGGSGTRVVTELLKQVRFFMGGNLNESNDYLEYFRLGAKLRQLMQHYGVKVNQEILQHIHSSLTELEEDIFEGMKKSSIPYRGWGWKTPPNFIILEHLNDHFKSMKYIHVIRNGLDMAYSQNQNQLRLWGFYFNIDTQNLPSEIAALKYWIKANNFAIETGIQILKDRFLLIKFEDLCLNPEYTIKVLLNFINASDEYSEHLLDFIAPPTTINRYTEKDISIFNNDDLYSVTQLGYPLPY